MRKFLLVIAFFVCTSSYAQQETSKETVARIAAEFDAMKSNFTESEDSWIFVKVIDVPNRSKDDIYLKALEILASLYKSAKDVVQTKDKEAGLIVGKGFVDSGIRKVNWATLSRNRCWHLIKLEIKDGRYRMTITVSSLWLEVGSDLGHAFNGTECPLKEFYPYWTVCKPKMREVSFSNLKFAYASAMGLMGDMEKGIADGFDASDDNW